MQARSRAHSFARLRCLDLSRSGQPRPRHPPRSVFLATISRQRAAPATGIPPARHAARLRRQRRHLAEHFQHLARRRIRIQGGAQWLLGRELRPACRAERRRTFRSRPTARRRASPSTTTTRRTGSPTTSAPSSPPSPAASRARWAVRGDWIPAASAPGCRTSTGTAIYSFSTNAIPAGSYEAKVALNGSWDVNYGAGGVPDGPNIAFTVPANGMDVVFQWNSTTRNCRSSWRHPRRPHQGAGVLAVGRHHRVERAPTGHRGHAVRGSGRRAHARWPGIVAGPNSKSWTLTYDPAGLSPRCARSFRISRTSPAFKLPADAVAAAAQSLKGQLAVGAARRAGRRCDHAADPGRTRRSVRAPSRAGRARPELQRRPGRRCACGRRPPAREVRTVRRLDSGHDHDAGTDDARSRERRLELGDRRTGAGPASTTCTRRRSTCAHRPGGDQHRDRSLLVSPCPATARAARSSTWTTRGLAAARLGHPGQAAARPRPRTSCCTSCMSATSAPTDETVPADTCAAPTRPSPEALGRHEAPGDAGDWRA